MHSLIVGYQLKNKINTLVSSMTRSFYYHLPTKNLDNLDIFKEHTLLSDVCKIARNSDMVTCKPNIAILWDKLTRARLFIFSRDLQMKYRKQCYKLIFSDNMSKEIKKYCLFCIFYLFVCLFYLLTVWRTVSEHARMVGVLATIGRDSRLHDTTRDCDRNTMFH